MHFSTPHRLHAIKWTVAGSEQVTWRNWDWHRLRGHCQLLTFHSAVAALTAEKVQKGGSQSREEDREIHETQSTKSTLLSNAKQQSTNVIRPEQIKNTKNERTMPDTDSSSASGTDTPPPTTTRFYGPPMPRPGQPGARQFD